MRNTHQYPKENKPIVLITPLSHSLQPITPSKRPRGRPRKDGLPSGSDSLKKIRLDDSVSAPITAKSRSTARVSTRSRKTSVAVAPKRPRRKSEPVKRPKKTPSNPYLSAHTRHDTRQAKAWKSTYARMPGASQTDEFQNIYRENPHTFIYTLIQQLADPLTELDTSIQDPFRSHLVALNAKRVSNGSWTSDVDTPSTSTTTPYAYSLTKSFWLPSSPSYFILASSTTAPNTSSSFAPPPLPLPQHLYSQRFFYWDPLLLLFNGIACPACSAPLTNKGRIESGPIKVLDLRDYFFIIGAEYVCTSQDCVRSHGEGGRRFASTDECIMRLLPPTLYDEFPAVLTPTSDSRRSLNQEIHSLSLGSDKDVWDGSTRGVSRTLWDMARVCVVNGIPKDGILQILHGVKNGVKEWPSQKPSTDIPSVDQDAEGDMVDVDGEGEIVGSDDEGEVIVQGVTNGSGDDGSLYVPTQNGDLLQSRQASSSAPEPTQVLDSVTPVVTETDTGEDRISEGNHHPNPTAEVTQPEPEDQHNAPDQIDVASTQANSQHQSGSSSTGTNNLLPLTQNTFPVAHVYTQTLPPIHTFPAPSLTPTPTATPPPHQHEHQQPVQPPPAPTLLAPVQTRSFLSYNPHNALFTPNIPNNTFQQQQQHPHSGMSLPLQGFQQQQQQHATVYSYALSGHTGMGAERGIFRKAFGPIPGSVDGASLPYNGAIGVTSSAALGGQDGGGGSREPSVDAGSHGSGSISMGQ